jgi:hypothetical protein
VAEVTGPPVAAEAPAPRRYLIATAVADYRRPSWNVTGLDTARNQIIDLFTRRLGYDHVSTLGLNPTRDQLRSAIRAFCRDPGRHPEDLLAVYITGHGQILDDTRHVLLTSDTDPGDVGFTALPTAELAEVMLTATGVHRVLLMLDFCYAEEGGNRLAASALKSMSTSWTRDPGSGLVIVSASRPHQPAKAGLFPRLLADAVDALPVAGSRPTHLAIDALVAHMNASPELPAWQRIGLTIAGLDGHTPPFFDNPRHGRQPSGVELAIQQAAEFQRQDLAREAAFRGTMLVRAMAYPGDDPKAGWWFTGRTAALNDLGGWLHGTAPQCVVTGDPGSGKSAVLGLIAAVSHPKRRPAVPMTTIGLDPDRFPAKSVDVAIYAQHMKDSEIVEALAAAARVRAGGVSELITALGRQDRDRPFTAIIDGIDEAATPESLCRDVLQHLARHSEGRIRLLLGMRPYLVEHLDVEPSDVVDLDSDDYFDPLALRIYTVHMLKKSHWASPYRTDDRTTTGADPGAGETDEVRAADAGAVAVAEAVAQAAGRSFLVARIVAGTLAASEHAVADPGDPVWRRGLPRHADQAMAEDLERRLGPDAQRAIDLLRPLAFAQGEGLPWENLWARLASAISGRDYTDDDLLWLRATAGSYVVETVDRGRSVYRLYHQALAEHLTTGTDEVAANEVFVQVLVDDVPYQPDGTRDWARAHPYTKQHLAWHAVRARRFDDVIAESEYLVHAVPSGLTPHLWHAASDSAKRVVSVYRSCLGTHTNLDPDARRQVLALAAAGERVDDLRRRLTDRIAPGGWSVRWSSRSPSFSSALRGVLVTGSESTTAVACTSVDGIPMAVTVSNGWIRLWNLRTGLQHCEPIGYVPDVNAIICGVVDGDPIALTGGQHGVQVWNLRRRRLQQEVGKGLEKVDAIACGEVDGTPVVLAVGLDGLIHVWNLRTGRKHREPIRTQRDGYRRPAIAHILVEDAPVAVVATGYLVQAWNLLTGQLTPIAETHIWASSLTCTSIDDIPVAITSSRIWNLRTGLAYSRFELGSSVVSSTRIDLDGKPALIAVSQNGEIALRDLRSLTPLGHPVRTGARATSSATGTTVDGTPVAITLGDSHHSAGKLPMGLEHRARSGPYRRFEAGLRLHRCLGLRRIRRRRSGAGGGGAGLAGLEHHDERKLPCSRISVLHGHRLPVG